jgi:hypothetical protein
MAIAILLAGCGGFGCSSGPSAARTSGGTRLELASSAQTTPAANPERQVGTDGGTALILDGSGIGWGAILPGLTELGGAVVLEEVVLDRVLAREAARRGLVVDEAGVRAEEALLMDEMASVGADQSRAEALAEIRRARGLGPVRYEALLRRNALLRAMVRDEAAPTEAERRLAKELAFGQAFRVRLFVTASESTAAAVRTEVAAAEVGQRAWRFSDACVRSSGHPSSPRGGLIERFSPADPAYPHVLGDAVRATAAGSLTPVLATPAGYAVVLVEEALTERAGTDEEVERVERRVRVRKERLAMERLARDLMARASVSPVDPGLARAWQERTR